MTSHRDRHPNRHRPWLPPMLAALLVAPLPAAGARGQVSPEITRQVNLAVRAFQEGRYEEALQQFRRAVGDAKTYRPTRDDYLLEAQIRLREGDHDAALAELGRALENDPRSADANYLRGRVLRRLGRGTEAFQALDRSLEIDPEHSGAAEELWKLLEPSHKYGLAVETYRRHRERAPGNLHLAYHLGLAYEKSGDHQRAADAFIAAIRIDPGQPVVHNSLVRALEHKGAEREAVIAVYRQLAEEKPHPMLTLFLARLHIQNRDPAAARTLLAELAEADAPTVDASLRLALAQTFAEMEMYDEAVVEVRRAASLVPPEARERIQLEFDLGKWLVRAGRVEEGIQHLQRSLRLHLRTLPEPPMAAYFQLGNAYRLLGEAEQAELYFRQFDQRLQEVNFTDTETLVHLGDIYMDDGSYRRAVDSYQRAVEFDPTLQHVHLKLARAHLAQGSFNHAIVEAQQVLDDAELGRDAALLLAHAYLHDQAPGKAVDVLRRLERNGTWGDEAWSDEASELMGAALLAKNEAEPEAALAYVEEAYGADPDDRSRTLLYARVLMMVGRFDTSRQLFRKVLDGDPRSVPALTGLGALEMRAAEGRGRLGRVLHLRKAVGYLKRARTAAPSDLDVQVELGDAERELARAEGNREATVRGAVWTLAAVAVVLGASLLVWRSRRWLQAERLARRVGELEQDLRNLIRWAAQRCWGRDWQQGLTQGPYGERIGGTYLQKKAAQLNVPDLLGASNFGHLVGIVDTGLDDDEDRLGFQRRSHPDLPQTRDLIVATLSYLASCRAALVHHHQFDRELGGSGADSRGAKAERRRKLSHMDRQVRRSLELVREHFDIEPEAGAPAPGRGTPGAPPREEMRP